MTTTTKATNMRTALANMLRAKRVHDSLEAKGITVKLAEKVDYYNFDSRLHNCKVRRWYRVEVSGNTYAAKDTCKAHGLRWDRDEKVWYGHPKEVQMTELGADILRQLAA